MNKKSYRLKSQCLSMAILLIFMAMQIFVGAGVKAKAENLPFSSDVTVLGYDKPILSDKATKTNAFEALKEVLDKNKLSIEASDSAYGKYISMIADIKAGKFGGYDGWMYAVYRGDHYVDITSSISGFTLQNNDKLIVYYGDMSTIPANNIVFSTKAPDVPISITLNNVQNDWQTGKPVVQPLKGITASIDSKPVTLTDNKIELKDGLSAGVHTLSVNDFRQDSCPKVIADTINFTIQEPKVSVRIEGLDGTLLQGTESGKTALDIVKKLLDANHIQYATTKASFGEYISAVGDLREKSFGGYDGWMYFIKNASGVVTPQVGIDSYLPKDGDNLVVYYGDFSTLYVNDIAFTPSIVKANESFTVKFSNKSLDWNTQKEIITPIQKASVSIDNKNYTTDDKGEISVVGLSKGEHTYKISGYNGNKIPMVVMDKGVFAIDNEHSPSLTYSDAEYDQLFNQNTSGISKNINAQLESTVAFIKAHSTDPWAAVSLNKFGVKGDTSFIDQSAKDITKYGLSDISNTDLEKLIINLTADGFTPYDFNGDNLVKELYSRDLNTFMINDCIFGLLAYQYSNIKEEYPITKTKLVDSILSKQMTNKVGDKEIKGWALMGDKINPDITGMAISALAPFYGEAKVKAAVDQAVEGLGALENESGYIADSYGYFCESLSSVILGLTAIGVNPGSAAFTKIKGDLITAWLSFKGTEGQFKHALDGGNDYIATEQALRALIALQEFSKTGKYNFYSSSIDAKALPKYQAVQGSVVSEQVLPKTGTFVDADILLALGFLCTLVGFILFTRKKEKLQ